LVLPVAVLFAVVFTVGALGRHSELTAAKASGISFHRLVRPLLVASLAAVLLDLGLTELAAGASAHRAELLGEKTARPTCSPCSPSPRRRTRCATRSWGATSTRCPAAARTRRSCAWSGP